MSLTPSFLLTPSDLSPRMEAAFPPLLRWVAGGVRWCSVIDRRKPLQVYKDHPVKDVKGLWAYRLYKNGFWLRLLLLWHSLIRQALTVLDAPPTCLLCSCAPSRGKERPIMEESGDEVVVLRPILSASRRCLLDSELIKALVHHGKLFVYLLMHLRRRMFVLIQLFLRSDPPFSSGVIPTSQSPS